MKSIDYNILITIASQRDYISSTDIAKNLNVSRTTVMSRINTVENYLNKFEAILLRERGRGFKLECSPYILNKIQHYSPQNIRPTNESRFYLIIFLLLTEETNCTVTELSEILHLSRPSVYKLLSAVEIWLKQFEITINKTRRDGIKLLSGEKRRRLAISKWYEEIEESKHNPNDQNTDIFKLENEIEKLNCKIDANYTYQIVSDTIRRLRLDVSKTELQWLVKIFQISIYRFSIGNTIDISKERIQLIQNIDINKTTLFLKDSILKHLNIELKISEIVYLYSIVINASTVIPSIPITNYEVDKNFVRQIKTYINSKVLVQKENLNIFLENLTAILIKELSLKIPNNYVVGNNYFEQILDEFDYIRSMAEDICNIIHQFYNIDINNQLSVNIIFMISIMIDASFKNLKTILIHDCNAIKLMYLKNRIDKYLIYVDLIDSSYTTGTCESYDVILSTIDYVHPTIPVINISQTLDYREIDNINENTNDLYQFKNFENIVKNQKAIQKYINLNQKRV